MKIFSKINIAFFIFGACSLAILVFFHVRGLTYFDEGYILNSSLRIVHGEIPYRDFDMVYTPISFTFTSLFLLFFGESIFAGRLAALTLSLFSLGALYLLTRLYTKNIWLVMGTLLFFISWGPTHFNFPWPTMFALCLLLYAAYFYLLGTIRNASIYFFFSGLFTILIFLAKQNFGGGALLIFLFIFFFLPTKKIKKHLQHFLAGIFLILFGYIFYLLATDSFYAFLENMYLYTLKRVFIDKSLETPFFYEGTVIIRIVKGFFYTLPLLIAFYAFRVIPKYKNILILIPMLTAMFYLLGIRPTTDYVHIVPLLAISSAPLGIIIVYAKNQIFKICTSIFMVAFIILGFYTAYYKGYQQWMPPLQYSSTFASADRFKIFVTTLENEQSNTIVRYIQQNSQQNEYIFINGYWPMIYFISDRKNATAYDLISSNQLPMFYQKKIVHLLDEKNVNLVIENEINSGENSLITRYISQNYAIDKTVGGFIFMRKANKNARSNK